ncbi:MAG: peptidoglycan DD-metalloendopeptidase family protein [Motiliproteus sp.]
MNFSTSTKQFPKTHLVAICGCALILATALVLVPSKDVAAERSIQRTTVALKSPQQTPTADITQQQPTIVTTIISKDNSPPQTLTAGAVVAKQPAAQPIAIKPPAPVENWLRIKVRSGDNLTTLFKKAGLGANEMYPLLNALKPRKPLNRLMPGEHLEFLIIDGSLTKIRHEESALLSTLITKTESGYGVEKLQRTPDVRHAYKQGTIEQSLFLAGQNAELSQTKIMELAGIFGWDVDFALDIRKGDSFRLIYEELLLDGEIIKNGNIVAAEFTNQDKSFQAIRYTDSKGDSNYFTPDGKSMRKAFLRTPVDFARISSRFNPNRKHPIFKTKRPHRGVDYAAPTGTPIKSSGDGKVIFAGRKGGYGKAVIVQHGQSYTTLYAHMNRIKPGMKRGKRVKQGQTIGYVGSTGYATGPHLHYEFRVNGVHRNPLTVPLPHAAPLPKKERVNFALLAQEMVAQLETLSQTQLALK